MINHNTGPKTPRFALGHLNRILSGATLMLALARLVGAEPVTLPATVVTASRVPVPSAQVGTAVTVITAEDIAKRQARLVSDVLRDVPGVAVNRGGPLGNVTQVRIRGAEGNHTLVTIDGVQVNDPTNNSEFDFANLLAEDVERIEVLRGPQSALWGSDALGGVINIITKRGREGLRADGFLEAGSFETAAGSVSASGGGKGYRFAATASFIDTEGVNMSRFGTEEDGYENGTLNATGSLQPADGLELSANGRLTASEVETDPQDFTFGSPTQGLVIDGDERRESRQFYGRVQGKLLAAGGAWEHVLGANYLDTDNKNLVDGAFNSASEGGRTRLDYETTLRFETPEFADAEHTTTLYLEHVEESFRNRIADPTSSANQERRSRSDSIAGEYRLGLLRRVYLSGSARHDDNDLFESATTWRITGAFLFPEAGTRVHGSIGTGVKNPGFFELFGFLPDNFVGNPDLKPEESEGWDIGVEQSLLDDRLLVDATYFESDLEDEILTIFPPPTFVATAVNQAGVSRRRGVELSMRARPAERIDLVGAYTYTRADDPDGRDEVRRPRHVASLSAGYRLAGDRGSLNLSVRYNGRMEDNEFIFATPEDRVTLDDFTLVTLAANYNVTKAVQLFGRVENLLDEDYEEVFSTRQPGVGVFAGVRVNLDAL